VTRLEALNELRECYEQLAHCRERFVLETAPGRWEPPAYILEEIMSDTAAYSERLRELEALLASEP
jgi:hypothetical protein